MVTTGISTTTSGVDVLGVGGTVANRTRANGTIIPRNNFKRTPLHRVDMRFYRCFKLGGPYVNRAHAGGIQPVQPVELHNLQLE